MVKVETNHFLVLAGHTLKANDVKRLGLTFTNSFLPLGGQSYVVTNPGNIQEDRIDVGIVQLKENFVADMPTTDFQFIDLNKFNVDSYDITGRQYILFGYPLSRSSVRASIRKIRLEPFNFRTNVIKDEKLYAKYGANKLSHQLLYYRKRQINDGFSGKIITGPNLIGMSGSGIWCVPNFVTDRISYFPTGIVTEFDVKRSCVLGTRISIICEIIHREFGLPTPRSRKVRLGPMKRIDLSSGKQP